MLGPYKIHLRLHWEELDNQGNPTLDADFYDLTTGKKDKSKKKDKAHHTKATIIDGKRIYEWKFNGELKIIQITLTYSLPITITGKADISCSATVTRAGTSPLFDLPHPRDIQLIRIETIPGGVKYARLRVQMHRLRQRFLLSQAEGRRRARMPQMRIEKSGKEDIILFLFRGQWFGRRFRPFRQLLRALPLRRASAGKQAGKDLTF